MRRTIWKGIGSIQGASLPLESSAGGCQRGLPLEKWEFPSGNGGAVGREFWGRVRPSVPALGTGDQARKEKERGKKRGERGGGSGAAGEPRPARLGLCHPSVSSSSPCPRVSPVSPSATPASVPVPRAGPGAVPVSQRRSSCPEEGPGSAGRGRVTPGTWGPGRVRGVPRVFLARCHRIPSVHGLGWEWAGAGITRERLPRLRSDPGARILRAGDSPQPRDGAVTPGQGSTGTGVAWEGHGAT